MAKNLQRGKFYLHNDVNGGHPVLIYKKNVKKNKYKGVQFTSKNGKNRTRLKHNINGNDKTSSYVLNQPIEDKRKGFGSKELKGLKIYCDEDKFLIIKIKRRK